MESVSKKHDDRGLLSRSRNQGDLWSEPSYFKSKKIEAEIGNLSPLILMALPGPCCISFIDLQRQLGSRARRTLTVKKINTYFI